MALSRNARCANPSLLEVLDLWGKIPRGPEENFVAKVYRYRNLPTERGAAWQVFIKGSPQWGYHANREDALAQLRDVLVHLAHKEAGHAA